jgi:hypothetical protein
MISLAMSVRQPWAQVIAEAEALAALNVVPKLIENRSRRIADKHIGEDIAIHAGLTWCRVGEQDWRVRRAWSVFCASINMRVPNPLLAAHGDRRTGYVGGLRPGMWIEQGVVIAVARLAGCHPAGPCVNLACHPWGESEYNGKPAWHIELADVRRLPKPVPARGSLALPWRLPEDVAGQVQAQLDARLLRAVASAAIAGDPVPAGLADRSLDRIERGAIR